MSAKKRGAPKSPPAPSHSLAVSFSHAQKIYKNYSHASINKSEVAKALGMSATSSSVAEHLFTLREFGLLDSQDSEFKVSDLFLQMNSSEAGSGEFKKHAVTAIEHSSLFAELLHSFEGKLPSSDLVATRLETQKRFNANRARKVARALEESLRFAGALAAGGNILPVREAADTESRTQVSGDEQEVAAGALKLQLPLERGRTVTVLYPADITSEEAEKISKVLGALVS